MYQENTYAVTPNIIRYKCVIHIKMPRKIDIASSSKRVDIRQMITIPHEIYFLSRVRDVPVFGSSEIFINEIDRATL